MGNGSSTEALESTVAGLCHGSGRKLLDPFVRLGGRSRDESDARPGVSVEQLNINISSIFFYGSPTAHDR
jgi:hypothetical protein